MDGVVEEVNARVLVKGQELLSVNGGRFEINRLLFADDTTKVVISATKELEFTCHLKLHIKYTFSSV